MNQGHRIFAHCFVLCIASLFLLILIGFSVSAAAQESTVTDICKTEPVKFKADSAAEALSGDWPTFGNGPAHAGYFPGTTSGYRFVQDWTANVGGELQQVAVGGGRVFITPYQYYEDAYLAALDEDNGSEIWRYNFDKCYSINPPTYNNGHVYVQWVEGSDSKLWSFYAGSGLPHWFSPFGAQSSRYFAPTITNGSIWVDGGSYGGMYGFNQADGSQLFFNNELAQYDEWTPSYYNNKVYSWVEGVFREHDPLTGVVQWDLDLGWDWSGWSMERTSAIADGIAYVVGNPNLYAINLSSGTVDWSVEGDFEGTPAVANGKVYALKSGGVTVYNAANGSYIGVYPGDVKLAGQLIVTDNALIVASDEKTFVFKLSTFQEMQQIPYAGNLSLANNRLYIATSTGELRTYLLISCGGMVRIGDSAPYYDKIQDAYNSMASGDTLQMQAADFAENLSLKDNISVKLVGGYSCDFTTRSSFTTINGTLTINKGTVNIDKLIII
jgi:hypothetical protein